MHNAPWGSPSQSGALPSAGAAEGAEVEPPPLTPGQRRYVTVLFADVSGSSEHAERMEAEAYAALLEQFRRFARHIVPQHRGSIARLQGDGLLALFGSLDAHEDDGRRAIEAALDLHEAVATLRAGEGAAATQLQLHSGIHAGLVLLIPGDIERGRVDVVGEVPNTAARLCSLAGVGEIVVSAETLGPHANFFRVSPPRVVPIRGRSQPLSVLRVQGRSAVDHRLDAATRRGVAPFVGREALLAELLQRARVAQGTDVAEGANAAARRVLLCGEPGIGKSRLLQEFRRVWLETTPDAAAVFARGGCESYLGAEPLQPFRRALRQALGWRSNAARDDNEAALRSALAALDLALAPHAESLARLLAGRRLEPGHAQAAELLRPPLVAQALAALARRAPLVLVLDDWQWADDASRQALDLLHAVPGPLQLFTVLAARNGMGEEDSLADTPVLRMTPLDGQAGARAIAELLPQCDPFLAQQIVARAGGSPLFIEELCHAAAAAGALPALPASSGPAWINSLVASRMARLPEAQAQALQVAAVLGERFEAQQLQALLDTSDAADLVQALVVQDFLLPDLASAPAQANTGGPLRFKHGLTREAVYATMERGRRRVLHLRVAEALESGAWGGDAEDHVQALAHHYDAAGINLPAARFAEAAGDQALAALAPDRARAHFITALRALDSLPALSTALQRRWCELAQKLGQACVFDPLDVNQGLPLFQRAAELARAVGDDKLSARAEYWLGYVSYGAGRPRQAVRHCERALVHAQAGGDGRLAAQVQATLGQALASAGRYGAALPLLQQAVASKQQHSRPGSSVAVGSAYALARTAYSLGDLGRFDEAAESFAQALHLLGDRLHIVGASVRELVCAVHLWQGRWAEAEAAGLAGADIALRCRSHYLLAMGRALAACGSYAAGGGGLALQALRDATQWIDARGGAVSTSLNHGWLVQAHSQRGSPAEARAAMTRLLQRARLQDRHGLAHGARALALAAAREGGAQRAARWLAMADRAAAGRTSAREHAVNALAQAQAALLLDQRARARAPLDAALAGFERMQMPWHLAQAQALLAQV
jgi:class 3 adenylate cyclase/tetratricopeptide (TPR) repeat protein